MKLVDFALWGGLATFCIALYIKSPLNLRLKKEQIDMVLQVGPVLLAFVAVIALLYRVDGTKGLQLGMTASYKTTAKFLPMIVILFPLMAFGGVLCNYYMADIVKMLKGNFGYFGTLGAAFITPTSNAVIVPIKECWLKPELQPIILYFLTTSGLVCWPIFFFRAVGFSMNIVTPMYITNWVVAIAILPGFYLWSKAIQAGGLIQLLPAYLRL